MEPCCLETVKVNRSGSLKEEKKIGKRKRKCTEMFWQTRLFLPDYKNLLNDG